MVKKILIVSTIFLIAVSQHISFAQYAPSVQSDETQELSYNQDNLLYEIGKGVHMVDAGKTLLFTGASFALTGVACFIGGAAMYDQIRMPQTCPCIHCLQWQELQLAVL